MPHLESLQRFGSLPHSSCSSSEPLLRASAWAAGVGGHGNSPVAAGAWPGTQICQCGANTTSPEKLLEGIDERGGLKIKSGHVKFKIKESLNSRSPSVLCFGKGGRASRLGHHVGFLDLKFTDTLEIGQPDL